MSSYSRCHHKDDRRVGVPRIEILGIGYKHSALCVRQELLRDGHGKLTFWSNNGFRKNPERWTYLKGIAQYEFGTRAISHCSMAKGDTAVSKRDSFRLFAIILKMSYPGKRPSLTALPRTKYFQYPC